MRGNIYIKGDLHVTSESNPTEPELKPEGVVFHVRGDVHFHDITDEVVYSEDDVFIEDIFKKFSVKDIIACSRKNNMTI